MNNNLANAIIHDMTSDEAIHASLLDLTRRTLAREESSSMVDLDREIGQDIRDRVKANLHLPDPAEQIIHEMLASVSWSHIGEYYHRAVIDEPSPTPGQFTPAPLDPLDESGEELARRVTMAIDTVYETNKATEPITKAALDAADRWDEDVTEDDLPGFDLKVGEAIRDRFLTGPLDAERAALQGLAGAIVPTLIAAANWAKVGEEYHDGVARQVAADNPEMEIYLP